MARLYALVGPAYLNAVCRLIIVLMALVSVIRDDTRRYHSALQTRLDMQ